MMEMGALARAPGVLRRLADDRRGVIALKFALAVPALAMLAAGAIDLRAVAAHRAEFQHAAEAAALAGARDLALAISDDSAGERAKAYALAKLGAEHAAASITHAILDDVDGARILEVRVQTRRPSFFGNLLPPGGWNVEAVAAATSVSMTPLCVVASGGGGKTEKVIEIADDGVITAANCLIHSNYDVRAGKGRITAGVVQASTGASGSILPAARTSAPRMDDPFADMAIRTGQSCSGSENKLTFESGRHTIPAGVHCGGFAIKKTAEVTLAPGDHYFLKGDLEVDDDARLVGVDVALIFDKDSKSDFKGRARVDLDGRKTGAFAGFVLITTRENTNDFKISSDRVDRLLGVLYIPAARLFIEGGKDIAKASDWTVIVAQSIELKGTPSLVINSNYAGSEVPVPAGVGPSQGGSRLVR